MKEEAGRVSQERKKVPKPAVSAVGNWAGQGLGWAGRVVQYRIWGGTDSQVCGKLRSDVAGIPGDT